MGDAYRGRRFPATVRGPAPERGPGRPSGGRVLPPPLA
ncbi:hypothetical protein B005_1861 [Nocardiopsis alba ATCC BAA-2165]|uniref:Uncharacterized protein n=1 Tax=Nocardiopsis alba (strain ATCC BAA-2165 / BE74) TaxID=1205910 RepID=J7LHI2_NOCAA|nr:hypothetical protein B005_1861 [Nocardiopsis alba ATCC BAA-2165]